MKRNKPVDFKDPSSRNETLIIKERLDQLFPNAKDNLRQIPINHKGIYIEQFNHVKLESLKGISADLLSYSSDLKYHYLNSFAALYCLESNEVSIFYRGLPLCLAEAYNLLLCDKNDFIKYRIFQRLNRTGFICLKPSRKCLDTNDTNDNLQNCLQESSTNPTKFVYEIDSIYLDFEQVLSNLREHGPKEQISKDDSSVKSIYDLYDIIFEVYQKENFMKNKPSKGKEGKPDYYLIICDDINDKYNQSIGNRLGQIPNELNERLMFAIIDGENTICFVQFSSENSHELVLLQT